MGKPFLIDLEARVLLLSDGLDMVKRFGKSISPLDGISHNIHGSLRKTSPIIVLARFEDIVKLLFQCGTLRKWPIRLFLMTENDVLQDRFRHSHESWYFGIHLGTFG